MKRSTAFLLAALTLMTGMVLGFLFSPVKGGIHIGNNSGNTKTGNPCTSDIEI